MKILIIGGGDMAESGIVPIVGGEIVTQPECDVRKASQVEAVLMEAQPDVVIVTAGVSHPSNILLSDELDWRDEIETNLIGSYHVAKYAAAVNCKTMIFIASVAGKYGKPEHSGYSASKCGVISLVQSLGMEGYNAYAISPGRVDTKMREQDYPGEEPRTRLEPTEIGEVIKDILDGKYQPGDNIIIRRIGYETVPIRTDKGEPWQDWLKVGQPKTL